MWQGKFFTSCWVKEIQEAARVDTAFKDMNSETYSLQLGPTSYLSPSLNNAILLRTH
jgi:hypothetical protein